MSQTTAACQLLRRIALCLAQVSSAPVIQESNLSNPSGDATHICGSPERLTLYEWTGDINLWRNPTNTGRYEVRSRRRRPISFSMSYHSLVPDWRTGYTSDRYSWH